MSDRVYFRVSGFETEAWQCAYYLMFSFKTVLLYENVFKCSHAQFFNRFLLCKQMLEKYFMLFVLF